MEWNPKAREVGLIGNYILCTEVGNRPMINFGTSSDRIGTPAGPKAYYLTFAKSVPGTKAGAYFSANFSEFEKGFNFPFGATYQFNSNVTAMFMNDGRKSHLLATYTRDNWSVSAMWIWFKHPGIALSFGF